MVSQACHVTVFIEIDGGLRVTDGHVAYQYVVCLEEGEFLALEQGVQDGNDNQRHEDNDTDDDLPAILLP